MTVDLADVQGTVLRGYRVRYARHFVLCVAEQAAAKSFLGKLVTPASGLPQITTAAPWTVKPASFLNVGITAAGLEALGQSVAGFPVTFRNGATDPGTAKLVGDVGDSAPSAWVAGLSDGSKVHVILSLWAHDDESVLESLSATLRAAYASGFTELGTQDATALPDNKVHFGYTDNISQPTVEGAPPRKHPMPDQQPVAPLGEFLLGYPNQNDSTYTVTPSELQTNSAFAAFRLLEQDVAGFEEWLEAASAQAKVDKELLAAKICGRWRSGVPLVLSPDTGDPRPPIPHTGLNDYTYVSTDPSLDDTFGYKCPVGAHMRRTNPRNESVVGLGGSLHRIVRRAMPYGPVYDPAKPDDTPRGLVGWFIVADLTNQFEFVMSQWVNDSSFVMSVRDPDTGANPVLNICGQDVILGSGVTPPGSGFALSFPPSGTTSWTNTKLTGFGPFVTTRGGAYCYLPGIAALRWLAGVS